MNTTQCHNPACHRPVDRSDAYLRSLSLEPVAFCSQGCVDVFDQLDKSVRAAAIPTQRKPSVLSVVSERVDE